MLTTGTHVPATFLANDSRTLADLFARRVERSGEVTAFFGKEVGRWIATTWRAFDRLAAQVAAGLVELGLEPGDRVAILGPTQAPWAYYDIGAQIAGCISLGLYPKQSADQLHYLLEHSEARVVFVADAEEMESVLEAAEGLDTLRAIVPWTAEVHADFEARDARVVSPAVFEGAPLEGKARTERVDARGPEDCAIFVYTSGTTGPPKCAMISHRNILGLLGSQGDFGAFFEDDVSLSFLPMAHVAERVLAFYGRINAGFATAYASSTQAVLAELGEVQPTIFGSVPRIFEKAYNRVRGEVAKKPRLVQALFGWATRVGVERIRLQIAGRPVPRALALQHAIADRLVFGKVRQAFGGRVRQLIAGAAPTPLPVLEFFWAAGLPVYEVYGMTEATVVTHANVPGATRLGTVGRVLPGLEHRIAADGEVLVRGPSVFMGYFKDAAATAEAIIDDWLHTGDVGVIDADGYLRITDRKKHLIITAGGKNVTPANIEKAIKMQDPLISHVHAHGDRRPYVSALVAPSPIETLEFGRDNGIVDDAAVKRLTAELMANPAGRSAELADAMRPVTELPAFRARIAAAVRTGNERLAQVEKVKRFVVLDRDFSQEAGEMTPTLKLRRRHVETAYAATFDRIYDEAGFAQEP